MSFMEPLLRAPFVFGEREGRPVNPLFQTILVAVLTGSGVAAILTFVQYLISRHDDKQDKKNGVQAELSKHGAQLDNLIKSVQKGNDEQQRTHDQLKTQGTAIAGLEHDRIIHIGKGYIQQGHISLEDYDDIKKYLYDPYKALGGNGTAEDVMDRLKSLVEKQGSES